MNSDSVSPGSNPGSPANEINDLSARTGRTNENNRHTSDARKPAQSDYVANRLAEIQEEVSAAVQHRETLRACQTIVVDVPAKSGHIYFIRSQDLIKIGFSTDVRERFTAIKVANPHDCVLLGAIPGTEDTELYFHKMFAEQRERGEWFRKEGLLAAFVRGLPRSFKAPKRKLKKGPIPL